MRVKRHQFPIAPDFARTAYSMQGQTLKSAIVDLNFDKSTNPVTAYVALSRVPTSQDILIMQPFKLEMFQQGVPPDADMLLQHLRGESVQDAMAARSAAREKAKEKQRQETSDKRADSGAKAKRCTEKVSTQRQEGVPPSKRAKKEKNPTKAGPATTVDTCTCTRCGQIKSKAEFTKWQGQKRATSTEECNDCITTRSMITCCNCGETKPKSEFDRHDRERERIERKTSQCKACRDGRGGKLTKARNLIWCCNCGETKPRAEFNRNDRTSERIDKQTSQCKACRDGRGGKWKR